MLNELSASNQTLRGRDMNRLRLPNRRPHDSMSIEHNGARLTLGFGTYSGGRPSEIFLSSPHVGSELEAIARDAAIIISIALQHSADLAAFAHAITRDDSGRLLALRSQLFRRK